MGDESYDTFDDLIDRLPQRSRNDVLAVMRGEQPVRADRRGQTTPLSDSAAGPSPYFGEYDAAVRAWTKWFGTFSAIFMVLFIWTIVEVL